MEAVAAANNFSVNGGDANDQFVNLPTVQPSPDAIDEFPRHHQHASMPNTDATLELW